MQSPHLGSGMFKVTTDKSTNVMQKAFQTTVLQLSLFSLFKVLTSSCSLLIHNYIKSMLQQCWSCCVSNPQTCLSNDQDVQKHIFLLYTGQIWWKPIQARNKFFYLKINNTVLCHKCTYNTSWKILYWLRKFPFLFKRCTSYQMPNAEAASKIHWFAFVLPGRLHFSCMTQEDTARRLSCLIEIHIK